MADHEERNDSTPYFLKCKNLTEHEFKQISLTRGITATLCAAICAVAVVLFTATVIKTHCSKPAGEANETQHQQRKRKQRIILYLLVATLGFLTVLSAQAFEHSSNPGREDHLCYSFGYFGQVFGLCQLLITFWAAVYLYQSVYTTLRQAQPHREESECFSTEKSRLHSEAVFLIFTVGLSLLLSTLPFLAESGEYGETGPWCWIKILRHDCSVNYVGLGFQLGLWYIPGGLVVVISTWNIILMLRHLFVAFRQISARDVLERLKDSIAETVFLVLFLLSYLILWSFELASLLIITIREDKEFEFWIFFALSTPIIGLVLPSAFYLYLGQKKLQKFVRCRYCAQWWYRRQYSVIQTNFRVHTDGSNVFVTCDEPTTDDEWHYAEQSL